MSQQFSDQGDQLPLMNPNSNLQKPRIQSTDANDEFTILHYIYVDGDDLPLLKSVESIDPARKLESEN